MENRNKGGSGVRNRKISLIIAGGMLSAAIATSVMPFGQLDVVSAEEIEATSTLQISKLVFDKSDPQAAGTRVMISANCSGGTGDYVYTYKVQLPNGTYEVIAKDTEQAFVNYTLSEVGTYNFSVEVSDGEDIAVYTKEYVTTLANVKINGVKFNKKSFKKNDTMKIKVSATPAVGKVKSKIIVKMPDGEKKTVKGYSAKMSASYKLKKKGLYKIIVSVKDGKTSTSTTKSIKVK